MNGPDDFKVARIRIGDDVDVVGWQLPQIVWITGQFFHRRWDRDLVEVRPLTVTAMVKGIGGNFARMSYWRFMVFLRILGLLNTPELERLRWSHLNVTPWKHWMPGRLWPARLYRHLRRKFR